MDGTTTRTTNFGGHVGHVEVQRAPGVEARRGVRLEDAQEQLAG